MLLHESHPTFLVKKTEFFIYGTLRTIHKDCLYDLILCSVDNSNRQIHCHNHNAKFLTPPSSSRGMIMLSKDLYYIAHDQILRVKAGI